MTNRDCLLLRVRVTRDEYERIRTRAMEQGLSVAGFMRGRNRAVPGHLRNALRRRHAFSDSWSASVYGTRLSTQARPAHGQPMP